MDNATFIYSFSVFPDETWRMDLAVYQLFQMLNVLVEMAFTREAFERFRSGLSHHGLTLREVERVPSHSPETVL